MPDIDFLIIGAQKAGTTSLFEYMRRHPQIHMPAEKEVYFFNSDRAYSRGRDWYLALMTAGAPPGAICGEATAQYMAGAPHKDLEHGDRDDLQPDSGQKLPPEDVIPARIKRLFSEVKLVCVLRDPVDRAYSHYRMAALSRIESRSFDEAVDQLLAPGALERARSGHTGTDGYVVIGEYARILAGFLRVFPREQLMLVFSGELEQRPTEALAKVFGFVGVAPDFVPENLNTRYLAGAAKQRIPGLNLFVWKTRLARIRPARALWQALPVRLHRAVGRAYSVAAYRIQLWNARRDAVPEDMPAATRQKLIAHFRHDSETLRDLLDSEVPWLREWANR
ncbi:MAG TPA: sulfotransferase domain-containing protein [Solirubrobacteraceae bacterium]|jgi:hypothetical protein|nr:sulfotransferase domain-containing protein [Solirubrobacteraceae bacterium]